MSIWEELLAKPGPIIADGAMGTMLMSEGLQFGDPPELWNVLYPDRVRAIHRGYIDAGSDIVLTNTFGGTRFRLAMHNLESRVDELNRTAAIMLRAEVDLSGRSVVVAGDIGPSGQILAPLGTLDYYEAVDGFAEQAAALVAGRVDVIWIETMSALEEMRAAFEGVRRASPDIPIIATMTFDTRGRTMMGITPEQAAVELLALGAAAIGGNCGNGPDELLGVVEKMREVAPDALIVAKSNVGMPQLIDGRAAYLTTPEDMTKYASEAHHLGAGIIGACCGSTPTLLADMAEALRAD
ncbi:MAG TPA: homocysteine S-methyltransferase family protein [Acidimicrobiia bacterium]|jgi:5-methyltetrahydrofolate--homocysteine methyltransferase